VDFYFYYPENWVLIRNNAMITVYIEDPAIASVAAQTEPDSANSAVPTSETQLIEDMSFPVKPNLSADVFAFPSGKYATVEDYWNNYALPNMKPLYLNLQFDPAEPEDVTVDGTAAKKYTYTSDIGGTTFKFSQVVFFKKNQVYTLTYTSLPDKFDKYASVLDTAIETFKFK